MDILEFLKVVLLGIVEGLTEWLPISSTGHLILVQEFVKLDFSPEFFKMFNVVIQLGAILAVVVLFFKKLWPFSTKEKYYCKKDTWMMWFKVVVACLPGIFIGIPLDDFMEEHFHKPMIIAGALILYGVIFIVMERKNIAAKAKVTDISQMTYKMALMIGFFQLLAMVPGTSRSGTTIIGAMLIGASRYAATEFTFFLAIPVMFGASALKLVKFGFVFTSAEVIALITGMLVAFIVSVIAIKFLLNYIKRNSFEAFGWYRIVLGCLVAGYFLLK